MDASERRVLTRYNIRTPLRFRTISLAGGSSDHFTEAINVSRGGFYFATSAPLKAVAQTETPRAAVPLPNRAAEIAVPPALEVLTEGKSGSDFMVDCLKSLGFDYMAANPASSFRGLHESLINYGNNEPACPSTGDWVIWHTSFPSWCTWQ